MGSQPIQRSNRPTTAFASLGLILCALAASPALADEEIDESARADEIIRLLTRTEQATQTGLGEAEFRDLLREWQRLDASKLTPEQRAAANRAISERLAAMVRSREVPLVIAARDGDAATVRAELARGVDPDERMGNETALMNASLQGYTEIVRLLLRAGADPSIGIHPGARWTSLRFAAMNGRLDAIELLLAHDPPPGPQVLREALFEAASSGRPKTLDRLVAAGANVDASTDDGTTPAMLAARGDHGQTIAMLAGLGADLDARDARGRSALMFAAWMGHLAATRSLLAAGADPTLADRHGATAFPGGAVPEEVPATLATSQFLAEAHPEACDTLLGFVLVSRRDAGIAAHAYGLQLKPVAGSRAWIAAGDGHPVPATIRASEAAEYPEGTWNSEVTVEGDGLAPRLPSEGGLPGLLIWPGADAQPRSVPPATDGLPYGTFPESVEHAIDADGDGQADLLSLGHCCKQPSAVDACEYSCGSTWQKVSGTWRKCEFKQPE